MEEERKQITVREPLEAILIHHEESQSEAGSHSECLAEWPKTEKKSFKKGNGEKDLFTKKLRNNLREELLDCPHTNSLERKLRNHQMIILTALSFHAQNQKVCLSLNAPRNLQELLLFRVLGSNMTRDKWIENLRRKKR